MRALLAGTALLVLATVGASAQSFEERRSPPSENLDRPSPREPFQATPDDDDDNDMGAPLSRRGTPSPDDDDDGDAPPPPKLERL